MKVKYKFQIYSKQGKLVKSGLNSRDTIRFFGKDFAMGNHMLKRLSSGELVAYNDYFIFQSENQKVFELHYKNYLDTEKSRIKKDIDYSINKLGNNTVLKLNKQFEIIDSYYPSNLQTIANLHNVPLGTIKSKLSRDIKKIKRVLDGEILKSDSDYRLVYLSDMLKLNKL